MKHLNSDLNQVPPPPPPPPPPPVGLSESPDIDKEQACRRRKSNQTVLAGKYGERQFVVADI